MVMGANSVLAKKITDIMQMQNVTVESLANKTGLARGTISNMRNGKNHYTWQLQLICQELNIPMAYFLDDQLSAAHLIAIQSIISIDNEQFLLSIAQTINLSKNNGK